MTFEDKFEKFSLKLDEADKSTISEDFAVQVNLTDEDCGGAFYIAYMDGTFSVEPYDYCDHTAMLTTTADDFQKIISGKLSIDNGIESGRFCVDGNIDHIKTLQMMFPKVPRRVRKL